MDQIIEFCKKYWAIISIIFTIISSFVTGLWWVYNKADKVNDTVTATNQWVQDHDDELKTQHDDLVRLKEDERLREQFDFKRK